jgi:exopolysaccharide production protein ExoZ
MPKTNWNIGIQILRGVAATLVVLHHSLEESLAISASIAPEWVIRLGACGVDIFFVISGFIIYSVTYGREGRGGEQPLLFLLRRFIRIFPLYWIWLLATLALWSSGHFYRGLHINAFDLGSSVFLLPGGKLIIGVAWTLIYEMYFYYLFSITLYIRNGAISVLTTSGLICAGMFLSKFVPEGALKAFLSNPIALEFCFGLILAHFINCKSLSGLWSRYMWLPGLILMACGAIFAQNNNSTNGIASNVRYLAWGLPALLVTVSFIRMQFDKSRLVKSLLPVGDASYSIYLTHPTIMILFAFLIRYHVLRPIAYPVILPLVVVIVCIVFGLCVYYFIERPILGWSRRLLSAGLSRASSSIKKGKNASLVMRQNRLGLEDQSVVDVSRH